jgi:hypothetical protein
MQPTISTFWRRWMLLATGLMVLMGFILTFTPLLSDTIHPLYYNNYFDYDAFSTLSDGDLRFHTFLFGVSGAVVSSWAIVMFFLVMFPLRNGQRWAWYALTTSLIVWFIGDGYASIATGFVVHAVMNLSFLIMMGIPLLVTYRHTR